MRRYFEECTVFDAGEGSGTKSMRDHQHMRDVSETWRSPLQSTNFLCGSRLKTNMTDIVLFDLVLLYMWRRGPTGHGAAVHIV